MPDMETLLQVNDIHHSYGVKKALNGVDFQLQKGELHALVGDHRAGKSTLIRLLCGALRCRQGEIVLPSGTYSSLTPRKAFSEGIGAVFQEESLVPSLNAVDNIFSGHFRLFPGGVIRYRQHVEELNSFCGDLNIDLDLSRPVSQLDKVHQHLIEFLRAIYFKPSILILDEISTRFTPREMDLIYRQVLEMKKKGLGIIYISHDMDEVMEFADRVTILKEGQCRKTEAIANLDKMQLYYMTYSRELSRKELRQANLELYKFKKYNEAVIRNIPVGAVILDKDLRIYQVNEIADSLLHFENIQEPDFTHILTNLKNEDAENIHLAVEERRRLQLEHVTYSNGCIYNFLCAPFSGDDEESGGTIILIDDKTEALRLQEYIRRTEQISSIAELAAGVAHEINNPLNIILNYMDLLSMAIVDEPSLSRLNKIEREIQRITEITGGLLSFSKVKDTEMVELDLKKAVEEALLLLKYRIESNGIKVDLDIPKEPIEIYGNLNKLEQVFINLIMNSLDILPKGGEIGISITRDDNSVKAVVSDNGPGVDELVTGQIFNPFFTTKLEDKNSGLGLSVSLHIMLEHKGTIEYLREEGRTTFLLEFPL
jgi:two-component system, NtrC family, sensor histidine kinase AtoS